MGLRRSFVRAHIEHWETQLARGNRPYRQNWPSRLFRHEPLENAVEILSSDQLLSRSEANIVRDIAPADIINHTDAAHSFVRLYFRPKNPTQYRIEGIRKPNEVYHGRQAPVIILFVFQALDILSADDVQFSDGNMQSTSTNRGSTEEFFRAIPFDEVFHEGVFDPGSSILRRRCAEVLLPSPLIVKGSLQAVMCRSPAERATLLHLLGSKAVQWKDRIRVYSEPGLFENTYAYMDTVDGASDGVRFTFHPRRDGRPVRAEIWVTGKNLNHHTAPRDFDTSEKWIIRRKLNPGVYEVRIHVEECLAYNAVFLVDDLPF